MAQRVFLSLRVTFTSPFKRRSLLVAPSVVPHLLVRDICCAISKDDGGFGRINKRHRGHLLRVSTLPRLFLRLCWAARAHHQDRTLLLYCGAHLLRSRDLTRLYTQQPACLRMRLRVERAYISAMRQRLWFARSPRAYAAWAGSWTLVLCAIIDGNSGSLFAKRACRHLCAGHFIILVWFIACRIYYIKHSMATFSRHRKRLAALLSGSRMRFPSLRMAKYIRHHKINHRQTLLDIGKLLSSSIALPCHDALRLPLLCHRVSRLSFRPVMRFPACLKRQHGAWTARACHCAGAPAALTTAPGPSLRPAGHISTRTHYFSCIAIPRMLRSSHVHFLRFHKCAWFSAAFYGFTDDHHAVLAV